MATFPTPSEIQSQYFQVLKSIKPSINVNDVNSDFVIRGKSIAGVVSGLYGDQAKVDNDSFVASMRSEALDLQGADLGIDRSQATYATGSQVRISGTNGTVVNIGDLTFIYAATGILYSNTSGGTISGGILDVAIKAQVSGQIGNVALPDSLKVVSPPVGVLASASLVTAISDGSDIESDDSYRARLLSRMQSPPAGGNQTDYPQFAFKADPSVRSAFIKRFGRGLGTVDVYITAGTTDIDTAVTNGEAIVRIPSPTLISTVQAYYDSHAPLTDMPRVYAPVEVLVPVSINVELVPGFTLSSVPASSVYNPLNLTISQLISREISRVLYKLSVGGRNGFVYVSDIEENIDIWLSETEGNIPVLRDRQVQKLNGANWNYPLAQNELASLGAVTIVIGV